MPIAVNRSAQISTQEKAVEQSLSTETDQAIVSQDSNVRFEDSAKVLEQVSILPLQGMWSKINPYPEDTPTTLLGRVVQLPDYTWSSSMAPISIKLLTAFLAFSDIHSAILGEFTQAMYRFLQCDYRVTIRINSTPFHQGALVVTWSPDNYGVASVPQGVVGFASFKNAVVLSASQQDQCTLDIPYIQLNPHYDLAFPSGGQWIDTRVNIHVLNALITSSPSIVDSVPISVFIQMTNIHTYGILEPAALAGKTRPFTGQSSKERKLTEAQAKDKEGLSAAGPLTIIKPIIRSIPFMSDLIDGAKGLLSNLDKPRTDQSVTFVTNRPNRGHSMLTGVDFSEPLSSFQSVEVSKSLPFDSSDMSVIEYCSHPALWYQRSITTKGVVLVAPVYPTSYTTSTRNTPDYLAFASNFFRYFRGSIKFLIQFVGTPFYSCRFKISVVHSNNAPSGGTGNGTGFMSRIVDVKGDAWTSMVVPFLTRRVWNPTIAAVDSIQNFPWLIIEAVTDVQGSSLPSQASYYMNIWRAAGPDYQLALLTKNQVNYPPDTLAQEAVFHGQTSIFNKFKEPAVGVKEGSTGYHESGLYMADQATTLNDMFKRYVETQILTPQTYPSDFRLDIYNLTPFALFSSTFLFWRGSRRFKVTTEDHIAYISNPGITESNPRAGSAVVLPNTDRIQVTIPWYCTELAYTTLMGRNLYATPSVAKPADLVWDGSLVTGDHCYLAAGDDFNYLYLVPPNPGIFSPSVHTIQTGPQTSKIPTTSLTGNSSSTCTAT